MTFINSNKINRIIIAGMITCIFLFSIIIGCSKEPSVIDQLLGSWTSQRKQTYTVLTFHANGNFSSDQRIADKYSQIVEKTDKLKGKWRVDDGFIYMTADVTPADKSWQKGVEKSFEILEISKTNFRFKTLDGVITKWSRVKGSQKKEDAANESAIRIGRIVVNLSKVKTPGRERYLCIDLEMILDSSMPEIPDQNLHPRVREATIFYLSSLTYSQVNKLEKFNTVKKRLLNVLNPYMKGQISEIEIKKVIVTSRQEIVDDFLKES